MPFIFPEGTLWTD